MDIKLHEELKNGNREAFDKMFRFYYPKLMGYTRILVEEEVARDIVQDVFLYIWEKRGRLDFTRRFQSYIFQMCYSRAIDHFRHKNIVNKQLVPQIKLLLEGDLSWLKQNNQDIISSLTNKDILARVDKLIEALPENRRKVFRMSFLQEKSNQEIAQELSMPQRTVESHIYISLKYLRENISTEDLFILMLVYTFVC